MLSEREKAARCALFDSYCHTILRNAIRDYSRHKAYKDKLEILTGDPESLLEFERFSVDDHPINHPDRTFDARVTRRRAGGHGWNN